MQAVMLCAGKGTRMRPLTYTRPKPLLFVGGKTVLEHNLETLAKCGVEEVILVVGHLSELIIDFVKRSWKGMKISFVYQSQQLGTAHALYLARDLVEDEFLVLNGDDLYSPGDVQRVISATSPSILAKEVNDLSNFGEVKVNESGHLIEVVEKPRDRKQGLANTGCYFLSKNVFDLIASLKPSPRGELELTDAINSLAEEEDVLVAIARNWLPISYPWNLLDANETLLSELEDSNVEGEVEEGATITGPVVIGKGSRIRSGSYIEGPCYIGENCKIGPNCYLRKYTSLEGNCKVGNCVEIKNSILLKGSKVPHLSYVGDSIIGAYSNLGAGTKIANLRHDGESIKVVVKGERMDSGKRKLGAIVGDCCKFGVGTLIAPGSVCGPFSWTEPGSYVKLLLGPFTLLRRDGTEERIDENKLVCSLSEEERRLFEIAKRTTC